MRAMARNIDCPSCGASTPLADGQPGECAFCHGRIDPEALGEAVIPWSVRLSRLARRAVLPLVFLGPVGLIAAALVAPQVAERGSIAEYLCECSASAAHSGMCGAICPDPEPIAPVEPPPWAQGTILERCVADGACVRSCPARLIDTKNGIVTRELCARAYFDGCFVAGGWRDDCGVWGAPAQRPPTIPPQNFDPDATCRSPECEQWCAQFPRQELAACAHAFRAGCTVDPRTPPSECGRYGQRPGR